MLPVHLVQTLDLLLGVRIGVLAEDPLALGQLLRLQFILLGVQAPHRFHTLMGGQELIPAAPYKVQSLGLPVLTAGHGRTSNHS